MGKIERKGQRGRYRGAKTVKQRHRGRDKRGNDRDREAKPERQRQRGKDREAGTREAKIETENKPKTDVGRSEKDFKFSFVLDRPKRFSSPFSFRAKRNRKGRKGKKNEKIK